VVGAGFGGLGAALSLAERGARVALLEALSYPGGCASTFSRDGYRFEAGATLFSGLAPGQLFGDWIRRHELDVQVEWIDPLVELRTPDLRIEIGRDRESVVAAFAELPGAPRAQIERFFALQRRVADVLWGVLERPHLLPPLGWRALLDHLRLAPRALPLLRLAGRPLLRVLERHGLADFCPLVTYLDALCRITVQCGVDEADALFALGAMDYYHRGTGHVRGGIGKLADGLVGAIRRAGGEVSFTDRASRVERTAEGWRIVSRRGAREARSVVLNQLPQGARSLLGVGEGAFPRLDRAARRVEGSWGACMLYVVARAPENAGSEAHHVQIVRDPSLPLVEGNHVFCSISSAADRGRVPGDDPRLRTITVSTHVPMGTLRALEGENAGEYVADIQARMRRSIDELLPEWSRGVVHALTGSPRTFERFTGRVHGYVGGVPRRAGDAGYAGFFPRPVLPGLHLVGDSVLAGQSTLATALGGTRVAASLARRLGVRA
jgi:phytoene dehydrogenase-like protein